MTAPPGSLCCRTVELAVRVLPADHRQRYGLEFIAELYGMPRSQQIQHSVRVLAHAWALRAALADAGPAPTHGMPMRVKTTRPFRCLLRLHRWVWASTEDGDRFQRCIRCGHDRTETVVGAVAGFRGVKGWVPPFGP
jgi:hypothetical protein